MKPGLRAFWKRFSAVKTLRAPIGRTVAECSNKARFSISRAAYLPRASGKIYRFNIAARFHSTKNPYIGLTSMFRLLRTALVV